MTLQDICTGRTFWPRSAEFAHRDAAPSSRQLFDVPADRPRGGAGCPGRGARCVRVRGAARAQTRRSRHVPAARGRPGARAHARRCAACLRVQAACLRRALRPGRAARRGERPGSPPTAPQPPTTFWLLTRQRRLPRRAPQSGTSWLRKTPSTSPSTSRPWRSGCAAAARALAWMRDSETICVLRFLQEVLSAERALTCMRVLAALLAKRKAGGAHPREEAAAADEQATEKRQCRSVREAAAATVRTSRVRRPRASCRALAMSTVALPARARARAARRRARNAGVGAHISCADCHTPWPARSSSSCARRAKPRLLQGPSAVTSSRPLYALHLLRRISATDFRTTCGIGRRAPPPRLRLSCRPVRTGPCALFE